MKEYFTDEHKNSGLNIVELEEDDVKITGEYLEGGGKAYVLCGSAVIDGETYHDFQVEFELEEEPPEETIDEIMAMNWQWYDYLLS